MKVNKKVSELARKLKYIGMREKERRRVIKDCFNPIGTFLFGENPVISQIKKSYEFVKEERENYEKLADLDKKFPRIAYN
jgi:hypothetical protein